MKTAIINNDSSSILPLKKVTDSFFLNNTPDGAKFLFWKLFQCWTLKDCKVKAEISDQEIAQFFDQLIDLVTAAYIVHQANGASRDAQEGAGHE